MLERFGLLLQLLSLLPDTEKCFVTLHEWWLQERYSVRPPKQNGHCVVVERDHFQSYLPKSGINRLFLMLEVNLRRGRGRGQQTIVSSLSSLIAINSHSAEHL